MKFILIFLSIFILGSCSESKKEFIKDDPNNINNQFVKGIDNDLKKLILFGNPKIIKEFKYNIELKNGEIVIKGRNGHYKGETEFYHFNQRGNLIQKKEFSSFDGSVNKLSI